MEQTNHMRAGRDVAVSWPDIIRWMKKQSTKICNQAAQNIRRIGTHYHISEALNEFVVFVSQNPLLALIIIAIMVSCGLPILVFFLFVVISVLVTFTGFIFIEGAVLAIGSVLLCAFIFSTLTMVAATASIIGVIYFGLNEAYGYFQQNFSDIEYHEGTTENSQTNKTDQRN